MHQGVHHTSSPVLTVGKLELKMQRCRDLSLIIRKCGANGDFEIVKVTSADAEMVEQQSISDEVRVHKEKLREKLREIKKVEEEKRNKVLESNEYNCAVAQGESGEKRRDSLGVPTNATYAIGDSDVPNAILVDEVAIVSNKANPVVPTIAVVGDTNVSNVIPVNDLTIVSTNANPVVPTEILANSDEDDDDLVFLDAPSSMDDAKSTKNDNDPTTIAQNKVDSCSQAGEKASHIRRSNRVKSVTPKMKEYIVEKPSGECPNCHNFVKEKGIECVKCHAFWHYSCAKITEEEVVRMKGVSYVCPRHRENSVALAADIDPKKTACPPPNTCLPEKDSPSQSKNDKPSIMTKSSVKVKSSPAKKSPKTCLNWVDNKKKLTDRIAQLETENGAKKQQLETAQTHQDTLRKTIASNSDTVESQQKIIADYEKKCNELKMKVQHLEKENREQKQLIDTHEKTIHVHQKVANRFMDQLVDEEDNDDQAPDRDEDSVINVKELYVKNNQLEQQKKLIENQLGEATRSIDEKSKELSERQNTIDQSVKDNEKVQNEKDILQTTLQETTAKLNTTESEYGKLKEKLGKKERELKAFSEKVGKMEEALLKCKEEKKVMEEEVSRYTGVEEDNKKLVERMQSMEQYSKGLMSDLEAMKKLSSDGYAINQLRQLIKVKDEEILELQENVAYTEKALQDSQAKQYEAEEMVIVIQNMRNEEHATLVDYRARYVDTKFKCQELTRKLDASDAQLKRSRSLKSSCVGSENIENKSPPVGDEKRDLRDEAAEEAKEVCAFALLNNGECKRKKCKFSHVISPWLSQEVNKAEKMSDLSAKSNRCMWEMVEKGSCPAKDECEFPHDQSAKKTENPVPSKPNSKSKSNMCFSEVLKQGSCQRPNCWFNHKIDPKIRQDKEFIKNIRSEMKERRNICMNEFREKGSCWKGEKCHFRHDISDKEKNNEKLKEEMARKWESVRKTKQSNVPAAVAPKKKSAPMYTDHVVLKDLLECMKGIQSVLVGHHP